MNAITASELERAIARGGIPVINVLDREHFEDKHIPGSINIPLETDDFADQVADRLGSKSDPVIVYCASEQCDASTKAARRLESAGFTDIRDFEPGVQGWEDAGFRLEHGTPGRTAR
jgi:rhodanese-related sulfurtransferase